MEIDEAVLLQKRSALYAILALLLVIAGSVVAWSIHQATSPSREAAAFCGNTATENNHPQYQKGKALFIANCASCHIKNMRDDLTGPALAGVEERWNAYPRKDLYQWIRRSQAMIQSGHPRATELWAKWKPVIMNDFSALPDEDIEAILRYIREQSGPMQSNSAPAK